MPQLNNSNPWLRWGVDRYSDGIVGIQWLLDQGEGATPAGGFLWELLRLLRSRADSLMAARDHSWERWFDEDRNFTTGSTSPFNYSARAAASGGQGDKTGFVHLLRHGVDIGQAMKTGPLWWRVDGEQVPPRPSPPPAEPPCAPRPPYPLRPTPHVFHYAHTREPEQ
eukprot:SAG11_NODE_162_length_13962_cov_19.035562_6_plen_167_part_00